MDLTWLEIKDPGLAVSIQDRGRFGLRQFGVPLAGALDPLTLAAANLLLGNEADTAGLEILLSGPTLVARDKPVAVALAGRLKGRIDDRALPAWQGAILQPGETLSVSGAGYLALSGGVQVPPMLGSRSAYRRAGLGKALEAGGSLPCAAAGHAFAGQEWRDYEGPIRLMPGPQDDHFTKEALAALVVAPYRVAANSDRMGLRLQGPALAHSALGAEILTDGVLPGAIQVPADGQPILLMADAGTTGGYAKIATVIAADLPRLGHKRPGDEIAFAWTDAKGARAALLTQQASFTLWTQTIGKRPGLIDQDALYRQNLISGMVAGDE